jgi:hypothetical protein
MLVVEPPVTHNGPMVSYIAPLVLGVAFVGLCLVLRDEQRTRRSRNSGGAAG